MEMKEIDRYKQEIYTLLKQTRINQAFEAIEQFLSNCNILAYKDELEQLKMSYSFMLQYLTRGILDPQRDQVLQRIVGSLYSITDRCYIEANESTSYHIFYVRRRELNATTIDQALDNWKSSYHRLELLRSVPDEQQNKSAILHLIQEAEQHETTLFNKIWCTCPMTLDEAELLGNLLNDDTMPYHVQCIVLSALFLSITTIYDENKIALLAQSYTSTSNAEVQMRALIYTILSLYIHNDRVSKSLLLKKRVDEMALNAHLDKDISTLQFLLARSRNTDNITRRVREDLMPDIMDMSPELMRKIKDKNAPLDISDLEANPEWAEMLDKSGVTKKMEEFNEMQLEGNDVFISTFSHLKSFPFFRTLANWFMPYHKDHSVVKEAFSDGAASMGDIICDAPLCNSDKYSFCLSMASIPESQRQMMFNQVQAQHNDLKELKRSELPDETKRREGIANRHLQDLYRFFKLFSRRREFFAVFDLKMDLTEVSMLKDFIGDTSTMSIVAEFYFKNEFYEDAIKYYNYILEHSESVNPIVFQKLGFCFQNLNNTREAIKCYKRYLLANENDVWTHKHIAACYRSMKRYDKALEYYKAADQIQPETVATTLNIGNCLLEAGKAADALQYYYKADFMKGARHRAWRPIAWCSFITGNDERALAYYDKIINEDKPTSQDHMNRGHVLLCKGDLAIAIESYKAALALEDSASSFRESFYNDAEELKKRGVNTNDIALIVEAILS